MLPPNPFGPFSHGPPNKTTRGNADAGLAQSIPLQVEALGTVRLRYPRVGKEGVAVLLKGLVRSKTLLDNWDELLRVAGSLKFGLGERIAPDFEAPGWRKRERLVPSPPRSRAPRQDPVHLEKGPTLHRQLNKGEALHALRRFLFFAHEGKVQRRQADQQTNQILCLN